MEMIPDHRRLCYEFYLCELVKMGKVWRKGEKVIFVDDCSVDTLFVTNTSSLHMNTNTT